MSVSTSAQRIATGFSIIEKVLVDVSGRLLAKIAVAEDERSVRRTARSLDRPAAFPCTVTLGAPALTAT